MCSSHSAEEREASRRSLARRVLVLLNFLDLLMRSPRSSSAAPPSRHRRPAFGPAADLHAAERRQLRRSRWRSSRSPARGQLAGPVANVEPMHLAADAPADNAPCRFHTRALVFGYIRRHRRRSGSPVLRRKRCARNGSRPSFSIRTFQTAALDDIIHGKFRLSLNWVDSKGLHP